MFKTELVVKLFQEKLWILQQPLIFESRHVGEIHVPPGFITDFATVPRVPPLYDIFGMQAIRPAVVHDYLFCSDSIPLVDFDTANLVFLEAMQSTGMSILIMDAMYEAVCQFAKPDFHTQLSTENKMRRMKNEKDYSVSGLTSYLFNLHRMYNDKC